MKVSLTGKERYGVVLHFDDGSLQRGGSRRDHAAILNVLSSGRTQIGRVEPVGDSPRWVNSS